MGGVPVLAARALSRTHVSGEATVHALREVDLEVHAGTFVAIMGPSGSGKSTLLNLLGALDEPTGGTVEVGGVALEGMSDEERTRLRAQHIGFVFQFYALLPTLSAAENVALPAIIAGTAAREAGPRALELLAGVGLHEEAARRPSELSGGQQQRVAIARALIGSPSVLLADEPTGSLDTESGDEVLGVLRGLADRGETVVVVTHDPNAAAHADRVVFLRDGRVAAEQPGGEARLLAETITALRSPV